MSTLRYDLSQRPGPVGLSMRHVVHDAIDEHMGSQRPGHVGAAMHPFHCEEMRTHGKFLTDERRPWRENTSFLSVVIAAKNEAASLPQLIEEITSALRPLCNDDGRHGLAGFEVLIIDDASTDGTHLVLRDLAAFYPELRGFVLTNGVGQSPATVAGIRAARGDWVATLDGDLQNDPADLVRLWIALPGHDAALGWRVDRQDVWSKRVISRWANRVRNLVLGQSICDTGCSLRIFRRETALRLPMFYGVHRFLGPLLLREGCRLVQVPVHDRPRSHGRSHYNLWSRSLRVVVDLLGVAWLLRRPVYCPAAEMWESGESAGELESGVGGLTSGRWDQEG
jgi:dolichol-phosphate mannosyltransferase